MHPNKLKLKTEKIQEARALASAIVEPVQHYIAGHTTLAVERASLRLLGADGARDDGVPVVNLVVDQLRDKMEYGVTRYFVNALLREGGDPSALCGKIADGLDISKLALADEAKIRLKADELLDASFTRIKNNVSHRNALMAQYPPGDPLLYLIVATGNIYEDVKQAQAAALQGADVIAVIRTTAQSLLDYVPYGATTEGFGGTYATQENFRIMRQAIDEILPKTGRYVRVVNYCSGLCMPEIAAMGALERLDMMLNDSMYGILFRDINMYRTFVDQNFSRMINALADIIINTGEDNYLTTSDAVEKAFTVLASQLINEQFGYRAGLKKRLLGLGHAFEIDPGLKNGFLLEVAQAELAREIFPECPLKYMPPTKFMTGDIFKGYAMNTMFNFASKLTGQSIHLLGMLSEAIHTPFVQDRDQAVRNAKYVMNSMADLGDEISFRPDGIIMRRAHEVLDQTLAFLKEVRGVGLFGAIEQGMFAEVKRHKHGGKGFDGVFKKAEGYLNPVEDRLKKALFLVK